VAADARQVRLLCRSVCRQVPTGTARSHRDSPRVSLPAEPALSPCARCRPAGRVQWCVVGWYLYDNDRVCRPFSLTGNYPLHRCDGLVTTNQATRPVRGPTSRPGSRLACKPCTASSARSADLSPRRRMPLDSARCGLIICSVAAGMTLPLSRQRWNPASSRGRSFGAPAGPMKFAA
jgi:hypothetical protein